MLGGYLRPRSGPILTRDEELGKRDDDFRPKTKSSLATTLLSPSTWRKRRVLALFITACLVYVFVHNIPTDLGTIDQRLGAHLPKRPDYSPGAQGSNDAEPKGPPPVSSKSEKSVVPDDQFYFDGAVKFYKLAASLHGAAKTNGHRPTNHNILFAASSLRSVANFMPLACEMARYSRNWVHMAVMGRDPLPIETILDINGVNTNDCPIFFHDARPDYSEFSTESRAEISVAGAMKHINDFLHPQAVIMDDSVLEDKFFTRAMRFKTKEYERPLIELPAGLYEDFIWMTRLDSISLASWFRPTIDILVHAPPSGSGGLVRLMKSLLAANYAGLQIPKISIEIPDKIHPFMMRYLEDLKWPPSSQPASPLQTRTLSLRHRIPSTRLAPEDASIRFIESFYPSNTYDNHVLILSPRAELSPLYFHYLFYSILEYKYSSYDYPETEALLGLALDVPTSFVNGSGEFFKPTMAQMNSERYTKDENLDKSLNAFFTYQAPSAGASLIFGDKWITLHDYLSNRVVASHTGKAQKNPKLVSETEPSWLEYVLELMRARCWTMLHPPTSFATIHNDLAQIPEEYVRPKKSSESGTDQSYLDRLKDEPFLLAADPPSLSTSIESPVLKEPVALHQVLPFGGDLPELPHLPFISYTGDIGNISQAYVVQDEFLIKFRREIGGCDEATAKRERIVYEGLTDDLFCLPGQEYSFEETFDEGGTSEATSDKGIANAQTTTTATSAEPTTTTAEATTKTDAEKEGPTQKSTDGSDTEKQKESRDKEDSTNGGKQ